MRPGDTTCWRYTRVQCCAVHNDRYVPLESLAVSLLPESLLQPRACTRGWVEISSVVSVRRERQGLRDASLTQLRFPSFRPAERMGGAYLSSVSVSAVAWGNQDATRIERWVGRTGPGTHNRRRERGLSAFLPQLCVHPHMYVCMCSARECFTCNLHPAGPLTGVSRARRESVFGI